MSSLISIAPMMEYTDRHCRYFLRLIAPHVRLYTEMITCHALKHGDMNYLLDFNTLEHPIALQVGGSDPNLLSDASKMGEQHGYDEINLNVGCPSDRVKQGKFGACLMLDPNLVADLFHAMQKQVQIPVTIKCRIGVDHQDSYEHLYSFIQTTEKAGCKIFIIHARKAWLSGLSPKQNREIPPLKYDIVNQIKKDFPHLTIVINGGIQTASEVHEHLKKVDGVMIGRAAYFNPYLLNEIEKHYFPHTAFLSRTEVIQAFIPYVQTQLKNNIKLTAMTRHILGLFHGQPGANKWRRYLSENAHALNANAQVIEKALALI